MFINCFHSNGRRCTLKQIALDRTTCAACAERCPRDGPKCVSATKREVTPIRRDKWPLAVRAIAKLRSENDVGIGSTIHRLAGRVGEMWEWAFEAIAKRPCGCKDRAKWLDERYRY